MFRPVRGLIKAIVLLCLFISNQSFAFAEGNQNPEEPVPIENETYVEEETYVNSDINSVITISDYTIINPKYNDVIDETNLFSNQPESSLLDEYVIHLFETIETAGAYFRKMMKERSTRIVFQMYLNDISEEALISMAESIVEYALIHTGDPEEGDYLKYQFGGYSVDIQAWDLVDSPMPYKAEFQYDIAYFTSLDQEDRVALAVDKILDEFGDISTKTQYQKALDLYEWITSNVSYDSEHINDNDYRLKYTGFGAALNKTALSQGFSLLLYRLALSLGLDARIISGQYDGNVHTWNIIKIKDNYYNLDSAQDIGLEPESYHNFLKGNNTFSDRKKDEEYSLDSFINEFPVSDSDYDSNILELNFKEYTLEEGDSFRLYGYPADNITWESSDTEIVEVDRSGFLTAVKKGTAVIKAVRGSINEECIIHVNTKNAWLEDFDYRINENQKVITLTNIKTGKKPKDIFVKRKCLINGVSYDVQIQSYCFQPKDDPNNSNPNKFTETIAFEERFVLPESCKEIFFHCTALRSIDLSRVDSSKVTNMDAMFRWCNSLEDINLKGFDTSKVTSMKETFSGCQSLKRLDLSSFVTDKVTSMNNMFFNCRYLRSLDITRFNTSNVTDFGSMFEKCQSLKNLDLSNLDTSNATTFRGMFSDCSSLQEIDLSKFNTSNVTDMAFMFELCKHLKHLDLQSFDTGKVTDMSWMFCTCTDLEDLNISSFNTSNVTNMNSIFGGCNNLSELDVSNFDTGNVTLMGHMFNGCEGLNKIDLSSFNTSNVTYMNGMFHGCKNLSELDLSHFDTRKVISMSSMFNSCTALKNLDLSGFKTDSLTDMSWMFHYCLGLETLDISGFNTSNVTDMMALFDFCNSLKSLDISSFDTGNVINMDVMFQKCLSLTELDVSKLDTSKVESMKGMFNGVDNLMDIDISNFDTSNVKDMSYMFYANINLRKVNLSGIDTSNVTNMAGMFMDCWAINDLDFSGLEFTNLSNASLALYNCKSLNTFRTPKTMNETVSFDLPSVMYDVNENTYEVIDHNSPSRRLLFKNLSDIAQYENTTVSEFHLNEKEIIINDCTPKLLTKEIIPEGALNKGIEWKIADPQIATINENGEVKGVNIGSTLVRAQTVDGGYADECKIVVTAVHDYGEWKVTKSATCTEDGEETRTCSHDASHTETRTIEKTGHSWSEWKVTKEATEDEEGLEERTCSKCSEKETRSIPKLNHVHSLEKTDAKDPSCEENGNITYWHCEKCGRYFSDSEGKNEINAEDIAVKALGHKYEFSTWKWSEDNSTAEAEFICTNDSSHKETITATVTSETVAATCETAGKTTYTAKTVFEGKEYTDTKEVIIQALGHDYGEWKVTKPATCTEDGTEARTCSHDASHTETRTVEKTGHNWSEWKTVKEATEDEEGLEERTCSNCSEKETRKIPVKEKPFQFDDVADPSRSFYDAVYWAYNNEITTGTSKEPPLFSPFNTCTRAQFVTFLWRQMGKPEPKSIKSPFKDVQDQTKSYYKAVLWALENKITTGTSATTFDPGRKVTRGQVAAFLYRAAGSPAVTGKNPFSDVPAGRSFTDAIIWMVEKGITTGKTPTTFDPNGDCTRGATVTFLYRAYKTE